MLTGPRVPVQKQFELCLIFNTFHLTTLMPMAAGSCGSKNNASQDPHDPPGYVRDIVSHSSFNMLQLLLIFCLGRPCPTGEQKRRWQRMLGEQHCIGGCFFNVLSLRAFPGHVAISGLGSRQQPKKKNTTVEMESRCWGRTMMVGEAEGDRIEMVKVGTGLRENRWECARAVNVHSQL